ncbi:hypothetical protein PIB30_014515 [Stylosanthes scabra]|uniref:WPP domain-containing protein n=1 Tax=Stylosanthes scabra TaxID=79078 RepID=A0ABU6X487_9FABA|nr:hypothetical protein [Stylosanthes scabra]
MDEAVEWNFLKGPISVKLWPLSQNTRDKIVERISKHLSTKSIFTQNFGTLDMEEAMVNAKEIEDASFITASLHHETHPDGDGSFAVKLYAKECSKLELELLTTLSCKSGDTEELGESDFVAERPKDNMNPR